MSNSFAFVTLLKFKQKYLYLTHIFVILPLIIIFSLFSLNVHAESSQTILVVGDSLSAEYGLERGKGWVALMTQKIEETPAYKGNVRVVNASISGDTTAGGQSRLARAIEQNSPSIVVIELGANDALRGLSLEHSKNNLRAMIETSQKAGAAVLILGVKIPPNYGRAYTEQFANMYEALSNEYDIALVPFFLAGVADAPEASDYFQKDRTHPNEKAHPIILQNVWPEIDKLLHSGK